MSEESRKKSEIQYLLPDLDFCERSVDKLMEKMNLDDVQKYMVMCDVMSKFLKIKSYNLLNSKIKEQALRIKSLEREIQESRLENDYKKDKEIEIEKLNNELESFKKTIEDNNNLYESMIDKTTQSLEKIIKNAESFSKIQ